ncbi:hypothetical protein STEG23_030942, partial [Scotinomys teguina]
TKLEFTYEIQNTSIGLFPGIVLNNYMHACCLWTPEEGIRHLELELWTAVSFHVLLQPRTYYVVLTGLKLMILLNVCPLLLSTGVTGDLVSSELEISESSPEWISAELLLPASKLHQSLTSLLFLVLTMPSIPFCFLVKGISPCLAINSLSSHYQRDFLQQQMRT